jgi:hypothetical protein
MTVAVNTLITEFTLIANDAGLVNWTTSELLIWLNEGQVELLVPCPDAKIKTTSFPLVAGAKQGNPTDCVTVLELRQNVSGDAITPCAREALDLFYPGWMNETQSAVIKHYMDDQHPDVFYVYPPAIDGTQVAITYQAMPNTVTSGGNIDVRDIYAARLLNYMVYRAYSKDASAGTAERAAAYYQLFKG